MDKVAVSLLVLISVSAAKGGFISKPVNVAAVSGGTVSFTCRGQTSDAILIWQKSTLAQPTVFNNVALNTEVYLDPVRYNVNFNEATFASTFTIYNVQSSDAGVFSCLLFSPASRAYAQLVVIDSPPYCSSDTPLEQASVGTTLALTCRVGYSSATNYRPSMAWTLTDGRFLPTTDQSTNDQVVNIYYATVTQEMVGQQIKVETSFPRLTKSQLPDNSWDHDLNSAPYTNTYTSSPFNRPNVITPVSQVTFLNEKLQYYVGETIRCQSNGLPVTTKKWTDGYNTLNVDYLYITSIMVGQNTWTCIASHNIQGTEYSQRRTLSFSVTNSFISSSNTIHWSTMSISISFFVVLLNL